MYDFANAQLMGRATSDAQLFNIESAEKTSKATFTLACNIAVQRRTGKDTYTIYRRIMVLGPFANYVASCQDQDGLQGRLCVLNGTMDNESFSNDNEVIRVSSPCGSIKIMDRRSID